MIINREIRIQQNVSGLSDNVEKKKWKTKKQQKKRKGMESTFVIIPSNWNSMRKKMKWKKIIRKDDAKKSFKLVFFLELRFFSS